MPRCKSPSILEPDFADFGVFKSRPLDRHEPATQPTTFSGIPHNNTASDPNLPIPTEDEDCVIIEEIKKGPEQHQGKRSSTAASSQATHNQNQRNPTENSADVIVIDSLETQNRGGTSPATSTSSSWPREWGPGGSKNDKKNKTSWDDYNNPREPEIVDLDERDKECEHNDDSRLAARKDNRFEQQHQSKKDLSQGPKVPPTNNDDNPVRPNLDVCCGPSSDCSWPNQDASCNNVRSERTPVSGISSKSHNYEPSNNEGRGTKNVPDIPPGKSYDLHAAKHRNHFPEKSTVIPSEKPYDALPKNLWDLPSGHSHNIPPGNSHYIPPGNSHNIPPGNSRNIPPGNSHYIPPGNSHYIPPGNSCDLPVDMLHHHHHARPGHSRDLSPDIPHHHHHARPGHSRDLSPDIPHHHHHARPGHSRDLSPHIPHHHHHARPGHSRDLSPDIPHHQHTPARHQQDANRAHHHFHGKHDNRFPSQQERYHQKWNGHGRFNTPGSSRQYSRKRRSPKHFKRHFNSNSHQGRHNGSFDRNEFRKERDRQNSHHAGSESRTDYRFSHYAKKDFKNEAYCNRMSSTTQNGRDESHDNRSSCESRRPSTSSSPPSTSSSSTTPPNDRPKSPLQSRTAPHSETRLTAREILDLLLNCSICRPGKTFETRNEAKKHLRAGHDKQFCPVCFQTFPRTGVTHKEHFIDAHTKNCPREEAPCPICLEKFDIDGMYKHISRKHLLREEAQCNRDKKRSEEEKVKSLHTSRVSGLGSGDSTSRPRPTTEKENVTNSNFERPPKSTLKRSAPRDNRSQSTPSKNSRQSTADRDMKKQNSSPKMNNRQKSPPVLNRLQSSHGKRNSRESDRNHEQKCNPRSSKTSRDSVPDKNAENSQPDNSARDSPPCQNRSSSNGSKRPSSSRSTGGRPVSNENYNIDAHNTPSREDEEYKIANVPRNLQKFKIPKKNAKN